MLLVFAAFIALGMPDGLLGVAWPSIQSTFSIPLDALTVFLPVAVAGYMVSGFFSGPLIMSMGIGRILAFSSLLSALVLIGYALTPAWWLMILLGFFGGLGAGAVDSSLNSYVSVRFQEGMMQWLHASFGAGTALGALIMTFSLISPHSWRTGYAAVALLQVLLAAGFFLTLPQWAQEQEKDHGARKEIGDRNAPLRAALRQPRVWLSVLLFFLYTGAELSVGTWMYSLLAGPRRMDPILAGVFAGGYWVVFTSSRLLAGVAAAKAGVKRMVQYGLLAAFLGAGLLALKLSPAGDFLAAAVIGFSIAPVFPALVSGTRSRVGEQFEVNAIGLQITASGLGAAVGPGLIGILARRFSLEILPVALMIAFVIVFGVYRITLSSLDKEWRTI